MPPPLRSVPSRRTPLVVVDDADRGRRRWHEGVWGVVIRVVEEEEIGAVVLVRQVPIHPGVDDGGTSSGVVLVGLRGSQCQAEEGGGGGAAPQGDGNDGNGYRGRGWRGGGKKGTRFVERSLSW